MRSIPFLDDRYPVRTVITEREDWQDHSGWQDADFRKTIIEANLQTTLKRIVYARETHSGSVFSVHDTAGSDRLEIVSEAHHFGPTDGYDAMVTAVPGILLCVWTADCIPLFLYDTEKHAAAITHCGWRGICSGIVENTIDGMRSCFGTDPRQVAAAFGPGICGACYEVGSEMPDFFSDTFTELELETLFRPVEGGKYLLDIRQAIVMKLTRAGVASSNICDTGICSYESESFASYRRDGRSRPCRQTLSGIVLL